MFREKNCGLHLLHWRWKQQGGPRCYLSTKIHSGTFQKTVILRFHAVKITYLNNYWEHTVMRYPIVHFCRSWKAFTNKHYLIWLFTHSHTHHTTCCRCWDILLALSAQLAEDTKPEPEPMWDRSVLDEEAAAAADDIQPSCRSATTEMGRQLSSNNSLCLAFFFVLHYHHYGLSPSHNASIKRG